MTSYYRVSCKFPGAGGCDNVGHRTIDRRRAVLPMPASVEAVIPDGGWLLLHGRAVCPEHRQPADVWRGRRSRSAR